ncbi:autotransporter-associated beta strand protein [Agrobacterium vitis]|nr:autotransporter-associated beta strand protein [Agrobacterium vitis]MBE1437617.1 autotransporter-associated beta strand protein [Agrobacterium vitis]
MTRFQSLTAASAALLFATALTPAFADNLTLPPAPIGLGHADSAPPPANVPAYVDNGATNQRGDACLATPETNAGVRVLSGFLDLWTPRSPFVDADQEAPAKDGCPAIQKSDWDGIPGSATDGVKKRPELHRQNIAYSIKVTGEHTPERDLAAYLDDRRGKNVSITDGLGPLADAWRKGAKQTTTITDMPADTTTVKYEDKGNNRGVGAKDNPDLGKAVDLIEAGSADGSTEPAKRYYKYARPYRASDKVRVVPQLEPAKSSKPASDGGFPSGHTAEGWRDALVMAYLVPQRYQEMVTRAALLGENRIRAGMHQTFDVLGGRVLATAIVAYNLNLPKYTPLRHEAYEQSQTWLMKDTGTSSFQQLLELAHSAPKSKDALADYGWNKAFFEPRMTYGYKQISNPNLPPSVPKGAEVLLETRLPYLTPDQRRVVLKTTQIASGYPIISDPEGWGRLDLFRAADGYGAFDGDVTLVMDASKGGFNAADVWKNAISGKGMLSKQGSGSLALTGKNSWTGGTTIEDGALIAESDSAFGKGDVYLAGGRAVISTRTLKVSGNMTVRKQAAVEINLQDQNSARLQINKNLSIEGGKLVIATDKAQALKAGETLKLVNASKIQGKFDSVELKGHKVKAIYGTNNISVRIEK